MPFCLYSIGNYLVFIVCYVSEYIGMCTCSEEIKDMQFTIVLFGVQEQPVRTDMALACYDLQQTVCVNDYIPHGLYMVWRAEM